jgi:dihydroneopterin aldolase
VRLGWGDEERSSPQFVAFDVQLRFPALPQGCMSDDLDGTVCYDKLSQAIQHVCSQREFRLIEHLGWSVFQALKGTIPTQVQLWVRVLKEKPPIAALQDGASFSIGDWNEV